jgi:hypothetical protein
VNSAQQHLPHRHSERERTDLTNLAQLLQDTNRLAEAEPLLRRSFGILLDFGRSTEHEHPNLRVVRANYAALLEEGQVSYRGGSGDGEPDSCVAKKCSIDSHSRSPAARIARKVLLRMGLVGLKEETSKPAVTKKPGRS